jgi:phage shock protein A
MSYFSRLTDIVTCNLSDILTRESEPREAIARIVGEMEEGLTGARRSVAAASGSVERLEKEISEHRRQIDLWTRKAKDELSAGNEHGARLALLRKSEVADVIGGLEQQLKAAVSTRDHLATTLRALEARLAEARRKQQLLESGQSLAETDVPVHADSREEVSLDESRKRQVERELDELKRSLGK